MRTRFFATYEIYRLFLCGVLLLAVGCHASKTSSSSVVSEPLEYPIWFWTAPAGRSSPTAVGYAPTSQFHPESSVEAATEDATQQLAKQLSVRIRGERISINQRQAQDFSEEAQQALADTPAVWATHTTPTMTIVLLGFGEPVDVPNGKAIPSESLPKPAWIEALPREKGYLYGQGYCSPRHRHESGWRTAEYNARIDLALNFQSRIRQIFKRYNAQVQAVASTQTDVVLNGLETVARWFDSKAQTYHVLSRVPISQNADTVRQQWYNMMPQSRGVSVSPQEDLIRRAFEALVQGVEEN